jgi:hypothetical protein
MTLIPAKGLYFAGKDSNFDAQYPQAAARRYSTVTLFARLRGWSTSVPFKTAT